MKIETRALGLLAILGVGLAACPEGDPAATASDEPTDAVEASEVRDVDPSLFLNATVEEVDCTLSDGTETTCYSITSDSVPTDHTTGPWCPTDVLDGPDAGGIWLEGGEVYDVTGSFLDELSTFYSDENWSIVNEDGSINYTETQAECEGAARPDVDPELQNHCVECLPEYLEDDASYTYVIPKTPVLADEFENIGGNVGVAFNGVEFAASAPVDAILGAYTIAPFDDCGGHINTAAGYHYHAVTEVDCLTRVEQDDGHAGMVGYAMDGFPLHDMLDTDGAESDGLDGCRGHVDDERGYHYHVTGPGENMILGCYGGLAVDAGGGGGPPGGGPPM